MAIRPKCGVEARGDDGFCPRYGDFRVSKRSRTAASENRRTYESGSGLGERDRDYFGLISFGIFLLVLGIIFTVNPHVFSGLRSWVEQMAREQKLVRPPEGVIRSAALFFGLIGVSDFFLAGIRLIFEKIGRRVLADILSGVALISFAYLIYLYGGRIVTWQMALAIEAIICGLLIIGYTVGRYAFLRKSTST